MVNLKLRYADFSRDGFFRCCGVNIQEHQNLYSLLAQFSIRAKIFGLIIASFIMILVVGLTGLFSTHSMSTLTRDMHDNAALPVDWIASASKQAAFVSRSDYRFIAESEKSKMDEVSDKRAKQVAEMNRLLGLYRKSELTQPEIDGLKKFDASWLEMEAACKAVRELAYRDTGNGESDKLALELMAKACRPKFQMVDDTLSTLLDINQKQSDDAAIEAEVKYQATRNILIGVILASAFLLFMIGLIIQGGIAKSLNAAVNALSKIGGGDFSGEIIVQGKDEIAKMMRSLRETQKALKDLLGAILHSAQILACTAEELAASTEQISASFEQQVDATSSAAATVEELTVSIDQISQNARTAKDHAQDAGTQANAGNHEVQGATTLVKQVRENVSQTANELEALSRNAQQIGGIATVIKEVADQTNLLALNAAIEAARAGEQGRGFAVVADEVRKLAERTTASATEISQMILTVQSGVQDAMKSMRTSRDAVSNVVAASERASGTIDEVHCCAQEVVSSIAGIASSTSEQSKASSDLAMRVEAVAQMSEENRATIASVAQATNELAQIAQQLQSNVEKFKLA